MYVYKHVHNIHNGHIEMGIEICIFIRRRIFSGIIMMETWNRLKLPLTLSSLQYQSSRKLQPETTLLSLYCHLVGHVILTKCWSVVSGSVGCEWKQSEQSPSTFHEGKRSPSTFLSPFCWLREGSMERLPLIPRQKPRRGQQCSSTSPGGAVPQVGLWAEAAALSSLPAYPRTVRKRQGNFFPV